MQPGKEQLRRCGEFLDETLETGYRLQQRSGERRQLRVLWLWALFFFFVYGVPDYLHGISLPGWHWNTIPRLLILVTGWVVLAVEGRVREPRARDGLACGALLMVGVCYALLLAGRPLPGNPLGAVILLVCGMYLFSPGRYVLVCGCGVCCSLAAALALSLRTVGEAGVWLAISYLIPSNLLAAVALAQLNRLRRLEYLQRDRLQLEIQARKKVSEALRLAHERNRELLYNALPSGIARQLSENPGQSIARHHDSVTVMFVDLVDFSSLSRDCTAAELVNYLDQLFSAFDRLAHRHSVEKIKTLGDAWMGVAGLDGANGFHNSLVSVLELAQAQQVMATRCVAPGRRHIQLRIGVHSGPLVAGVIGRQRCAFDVWGETVNIASRLQGAARPGCILASASSLEEAPCRYRFGPVRRYQLKGCGTIEARNFCAKASINEFTGDEPGAGLGRKGGGVDP